MIYAFLIGFLLGALLVNMYLREEEKENDKLLQENIRLNEELDKMEYLKKIKYKEEE